MASATVLAQFAAGLQANHKSLASEIKRLGGGGGRHEYRELLELVWAAILSELDRRDRIARGDR